MSKLNTYLNIIFFIHLLTFVKAKTGYEMFANVLIIQTEISHLHKYSDPLLSTLLKHLWR